MMMAMAALAAGLLFPGGLTGNSGTDAPAQEQGEDEFLAPLRQYF